MKASGGNGGCQWQRFPVPAALFWSFGTGVAAPHRSDGSSVVAATTMSNDLEDTPCSQRPRCVSLFASALVLFLTWRTLRWFLLLVPPLLCSAAAAHLRGRTWGESLGLLLIGLGFAAAMFVELSSGMSSSNWGTFFRRREPVRYWISVGFTALCYLAISLVGYMA